MAEATFSNKTRETVWAVVLDVLKDDGKLDSYLGAIGEDTSFGDVGLNDSLSMVYLTAEVGQSLGIHKALSQRVRGSRAPVHDLTLGEFVDWIVQVVAQTAIK